jgi:hypothetical protein
VAVSHEHVTTGAEGARSMLLRLRDGLEVEAARRARMLAGTSTEADWKQKPLD